jgi:uncharacterized membrane protein
VTLDGSPADGVARLVRPGANGQPEASGRERAAGDPVADLVTGERAAGDPVADLVTGDLVTGDPVAADLVTGDPAPGEPLTSDPVDSVAAQPQAAAQGLSDSPGPADSPGGHQRGVWRDPVVWLIAAAVFAAYNVISLVRYLGRTPTSWDLGIFTEYVKQFAHLRAPIVDIRGAGLNLLGDHFHPIVALIAPFFRLFPTSATLLVAQALLTAVSVLPVYRAGAELLGVGAGRAIAAAYGFSWGLQQLANFDVHEIAFAVPLLAFSLSALVRGRMRAAVLWALPLVFVKEDQGFTLAVIGLILVVAYRRRGLGLFLTGWGLAWSLLTILVIIPHFSAGHAYTYWSLAGAVNPTSGHFTVGGLLASLTNGASTKLPTLAMILLPTAFIAMRSPLVLAALPSLALRFIADNPSYWTTEWHYNATVMPIVFIAAIDGMARFRARRSRALAATAVTSPAPRGLGYALEHYGAAVMLAICAALAFQFPLSTLWSPATYSLGPHVAAENAAMALVPNGSTVATDLDLLAPLAARTDTYWLGNFGTNPATQYVVFDTASTDWQPPPSNVLTFVDGIAHAKYRQIYVSDGVYVFRRA